MVELLPTVEGQDKERVMRVLWIGDAVINSGFSVVTHNICNELSKLCDVTVLGIGYDGRTRHPCPFYIYPGYHNGDMYSFDFAANLILRESPDVVVVFNDLPVVHNYLDRIAELKKTNSIGAKVVPLFPINFVPPNKLDILNLSFKNVEEVLVYTDFSRMVVESINPQLKVTSIYHGVDVGTYFPVQDAKIKYGLKDCFVVGNVNSNTYRKRLDLFLKGFATFAKDKDDVKCLVHASNNDVSYDLSLIVKDLGIEGKTILSTNKLRPEELNMLYNLMDVNVNTAMGEGFGLSLIEGATCGVPILCPEYGNLVDIWGDSASYIKLRDSEYVAGTRFVGGAVDVNDMASKLNLLYEDRNLLSDMSKRVGERSKLDKFKWSTIAGKVHKTLISANKDKLSFVS